MTEEEGPRFLLLGTVEVSGRPPMSTRTSQLLALLITSGRGGMPVRRMVQSMWGDDPPPTAPQMVRTQVLNLRRYFGPQHARVVRNGRGGYRMNMTDQETDAGRFESLLLAGRGSLAGGRAAEAARLLDQALGLWRGPVALDGVRDVDVLDAEAVRLEELRLIAEEALVDAELAQGRAGEVIPSLMRASALHPLRERLIAQLMTALIVCGRNVEAADVYLRARQRFIAETGLEPSELLQRIQAGVMRGDQAVAVHHLSHLSSNGHT
jgi:DNA-binding SARP family transcriptional activator